MPVALRTSLILFNSGHLILLTGPQRLLGKEKKMQTCPSAEKVGEKMEMHSNETGDAPIRNVAKVSEDQVGVEVFVDGKLERSLPRAIQE